MNRHLKKVLSNDALSPAARRIVIDEYRQVRIEKIWNVAFIIGCFLVLPMAKGAMVLINGWLS